MHALTGRSLWRRTAAGGVAALAMTGLVGCGHSDHLGADSARPHGAGSSPANLFGITSPSARTPSAAAPSAAAPSTAGAASSGQPSGGSLSRDQAIALVKKATEGITTAHLRMDMDTAAAGRSMKVTAEGDVSMKPPAEDLTMSLMGQRMHVRMVDKAIYLQAPGLGTSGTWAKLDMGSLASMPGMGGASDAFTNPLSMIDKLGPAIRSGSYVGTETVDGTATRHYRLRVDTRTMMSAFGSSADAGSLPSVIEEDLWVDEQGRMRQSRVGMGSMGAMTMHMSDYGKPVTIKAPPADQVTPMPGVG